MPKLEDIEQFKDKINSLGNEKEILAQRGESIVDIPVPEQGVPDDISALLSDISDLAEGASETSQADLASEAGLDDFSFPEDGQTGEVPSGDEQPFGQAEDLDSISDLGDIFENNEPEDEIALMPDDIITPETLSGEGAAGETDYLSALEELTGFEAESSETVQAGTEAVEEDILSASKEGEPPVEETVTGDMGEVPEFDELISTSEPPPEDEAADIDTGGLEGFELPDDFDLPEDFQTDDAGGEADTDIDTASEVEEDESSDFAEDFMPEEAEVSEFSETAQADAGSGKETNTEADAGFEVEEPEDVGLDFAAGELESFDLSDDFDLPEDFQTDQAEDGEFSEADQSGSESGVEAEEGLETSDLESFDLPDDFDLPEEELAENPEYDINQTPGEDLDVMEEIGGNESSDEEFDIGSLDDFSIGDDLEISPDDGLSMDQPSVPEGGEDFEELEELEDGDEFEEFEILSDGEPLDSGDGLGSVSSDGDEFSLDDLGEEYSNLEEIDDLDKAPAGGASSGFDADAAEYNIPEKEESLDFTIDRERLERVTDTLNRLPRNLKFIIEDLIGNRKLAGKRLNNLVNKLDSGASVKEIAELTGKITGKRIKIPAQYERKTWKELEEEKQSLSYIIKHQILPYAGKIALISIAFFFIVFVIKKQVYDPLYSRYLYDKGYTLLESDNYKGSDRLFAKASRLRPFKKQFYRYAEGYIEKREYKRAGKKYIQLLGSGLSSEREKSRKDRTRGYFQTDKKGFLDYSFLKTYYQGEYAESDRILNDFILQKGNKWDFEALTARLDNFLNWGEVERSRFDSAEFILNDSISKFGNKPELIFRKIAYYLHSGRINQLEKKAFKDLESGESKSIDARKYYALVSEFRNYIENVKDKYADPLVASDFYSYMIDHDKLERVEENLIKFSNLDKNLAEPHYQLSRYWNRMEKKELEQQALKTIELLLSEKDNSYIRDNYPHSYNYTAAQRNRMEIFTLNRIGKFRYKENEIMQAQRYYKKAVDKFENYSPLPGNTSSYGHVYEDLGDIYYYKAGKYNEALKYFNKAYRTGYKNDNLDYKIGFINYKNRKYDTAAQMFYDITLKARENEAALFAFANASFNYGVYSPAKAYYDRVIEKVEYWKDNEVVFNLERRDYQQKILEQLMQVYNNQGVTLFKLAEKNRNQEYYSGSLVYLSKSAELYDTLMRDPETMNKSLTKPLAQLNMKWILLNSGWKSNAYVKSVVPYSDDNMSFDTPVIYNNIPHDLFGKVNTTLK